MDNRHAKTGRRKAARHPVLGTTVIVEMRTGSGTTVREVPRTDRTFGHVPGAFTQQGCLCSPALRLFLEAFYARIDERLDAWQLMHDYELGCPYAIRKVNAMRREFALRRKAARLAKGRARA